MRNRGLAPLQAPARQNPETASRSETPQSSLHSPPQPTHPVARQPAYPLSATRPHRLFHLRLPLARRPKYRRTNRASLRFETTSPNDEGSGSFRPDRMYAFSSPNGAGPFQRNRAATPWREPADVSPTCGGL